MPVPEHARHLIIFLGFASYRPLIWDRWAYSSVSVVSKCARCRCVHPALTLTLWSTLVVLAMIVWSLFDIAVEWLFVILSIGLLAACISYVMPKVNTWSVDEPPYIATAVVQVIEKEGVGRRSEIYVKSTFEDKDGVTKKLWVPMARQLRFNNGQRELIVPLCNGWLGTRLSA